MEFVYKILISSLPFIASYFGYYFLGRRVWRTVHPVWKVLAGILVVAGVGFTTWQAIETFSDLGDGIFNLLVLIGNVFVMALIAIFLAFGEPETK